jgi:hypothetical protein
LNPLPPRNEPQTLIELIVYLLKTQGISTVLLLGILYAAWSLGGILVSSHKAFLESQTEAIHQQTKLLEQRNVIQEQQAKALDKQLDALTQITATNKTLEVGIGRMVNHCDEEMVRWSRIEKSLPQPKGG